MSFIKDLFDKIFNKPKMLNSGYSTQHSNYGKNNRNWILNNYRESSGSPSQLDVDIQRFLHSYYNTVNNSPRAYPSNCYNLGYFSLVTMNAKPVTEQESLHNQQAEKSLLSKLRNTKKFKLITQGPNYRPIFYHIQTSDLDSPENKDVRRIYINCNSGHIAELAQALLAYNKNPNFYIKFHANCNNVRNPRGEKIVMYCNKNDINYMIQLLNYIKGKHPIFFQQTPSSLPFLQKLNDFSSISREPLSNIYTCLNGKKIQVAKSTNSFLSILLRDSYNATVNEIARNDPKIAVFSQGKYNEILGIKYFPYINRKYHDYLINSMKAKMQVLSRKNDLYIEGLFSQIKTPNQVNPSYNLQR